jgi:hypothetical protein
MDKPDPILGDLARSKHEKVKVAVADIDGILRGKYLQKEQRPPLQPPPFVAKRRTRPIPRRRCRAPR